MKTMYEVNQRWIWGLVFILLFTSLQLTLGARSVHAETINVSKDATIYLGGAYDSGYNTSGLIYIGYKNTDYTYAVLQFDLTGVQSFSTAMLDFHTTGTAATIDIFSSNDDGWFDQMEGIPSFDPVPIQDNINGWGSINVDVSAFIEQQRTLDGKATFVIRGGSEGGNYTVTFPDSSSSTGTESHKAKLNITPKSSNADLYRLLVSDGTLDPTFQSSITEYDLAVGHTVDSLTITPTSWHSKSTITVDGSAVNSEQASGSISLDVGENEIEIAVTAEDGTPKSYNLTVTRADNHEPTDIRLSDQEIAENAASGTEVGTLTAVDVDPDDVHTFELVAGEGDYSSFAIEDGVLKTAAVFDYEEKATYTIRVKVTDAALEMFEKNMTVQVTDEEEAPTDISLSGTSVSEAASGALVGTLSATDEDSGDTFEYSLASGAGDADNNRFQIVGDALQTAEALNYENASSHSIRVRATDSSGQTNEEAFTISVMDVNDAPTNLVLTPSEVQENEEIGATVGTVSADDEDGDAITYSLVSGTGDTDNAGFVLNGPLLKTTESFNYEAKTSYSIRVQGEDSSGATVAEALTVTITDVNEPVTGVNLSSLAVDENEAIDTIVGTLTAVDPDAGDSFIYELIAGEGSTDHESFRIDGDQLKTKESFDYEGKTAYSIRVKVTDGAGHEQEASYSIEVSDVEEAPTAIHMSDESVNENAPAETVVGSLSAVDDDAGETFVYSLVSGSGDTDNDRFRIDEDTLLTDEVLDYENQASHSIRVRVTDSEELWFEQVFAIRVIDGNDLPVVTGTTLHGSEDTPLSFSAADYSFNDEDGEALASIHLVSLPEHGVLRLHDSAVTVSEAVYAADLGALVFEPEANWYGTTAFAWQGHDGHALSTSAVDTQLIIASVNDAPVAVDAQITTSVNTAVYGVLKASDVELGDLHYQVAQQGAKGELTITDAETGAYRYTPNYEELGQDTVTFSVYDAGHAFDQGMLMIQIAPAGVADLASLSLDGGELDPVFSKDQLDYGVSVGYAVSSVTVTADVYESHATIDILGTPSTAGTVTHSVSLHVGENEIPVVVTAQDGTTVKTYTVTVDRAAPLIRDDADEQEVSTDTDSPANSEELFTVEQSSENNKLKITLDPEVLQRKLEQEGRGTKVTIPVADRSDSVVGSLSGRMVRQLEDKEAVVEIITPDATYTLPAAQINIGQLSQQFGSDVDLEDIQIEIAINVSTEEMVQIVERSATAGGFTVVAPAVDFTVTGTYKERSVEISRFNAYVERSIQLPTNVDPERITTGIVVESDGTVRHVPTQVQAIDGKWVATIHSLTNSTYSVIYHEKTFRDVEQHWAGEIIDEMGSRMIVGGVDAERFLPEAEITRAEFAAILVRGLGLKEIESDAAFTDVELADWYSGAVATAEAYSLIQGYSDGTFRPMDRITRQEAMVILSRAMQLTKLTEKLPATSTDGLLSPYEDRSQLAGWAADGVVHVLLAGITSGRSETELALEANITRAEVAVMVHRLLQKSGLI